MIPSTLINAVTAEIGEGYRMAHTLSVMAECRTLAALYALSDAEAEELAVAALLHDLTKRRDPGGQRALYDRFGLPFGTVEACSPKTLHAVTGAHLARERFPDAVTPAVFSAILHHTTASPDMSLTDKLLYLADYIEPGRTYEACVALRAAFYDPSPASMSAQERAAHLDRILLLSLDMTLSELIREGQYIHPATVEARNRLVSNRKEPLWTT